jgi:hypothetical protein
VYNLSNSPDSLKGIIEDFLDRLLPIAASRIGIQPSDLKRKFNLRFESSNVINASIKTQDNWENFEITFNDALMLFYHKMLKVYVSTLGIKDDETNIAEKPTVSLHRIASVCEGLIEAYWAGKLLNKGGFRLEELGEGQTGILSHLVLSGECFDVAHELGHAVFGIMKGNVVEYSFAWKIVTDFVEGIPDLGSEEKLGLIEPWIEESCADLIGLQLCLAQPRTQPYNNWPHHKQWLCGGAEITVLLHMLLQEYYDRKTNGRNITLVSSHPHDYLRWKVIDSSPEKNTFTDNLKLGKHFGNFALGVLDCLFVRQQDGSYRLKSKSQNNLNKLTD